MGKPLTKAEQDALDDLIKVCKEHGPKDPRTNLDCALLKRQRELESRLKEAQVQNTMAHKLADNRLQAVMYVTRRINKAQTEGILLLGALMKASMEYDLILAARATKPVFFDVAVTLLLAALPELKLVSRAATLFTPKLAKVGIKSSKELQKLSISELITTLGTTSQKLHTRNDAAKYVTTFAQSLDNQAKDIIEAIKDPLAARADVDEQTRKLFLAHQGKNQILSKVINEIKRTLVASILVEQICHKFIGWYLGDDVLIQVQNKFKAHGLGDETVYMGTEFDMLAEIVLYDMLRAYVNAHFEVKSSGTVDGLPDEDRQIGTYWISGLDSAQRELIYDRFGIDRFGVAQTPWHFRDHTRPPVFNIRALIKHWKNGRLTYKAPEKEPIGGHGRV